MEKLLITYHDLLAESGYFDAPFQTAPEEAPSPTEPYSTP